MNLSSVLWMAIVLLVVLWLIGLVANIDDGLIHLLLVVAIVLAVWNVLTTRSTAD